MSLSKSDVKTAVELANRNVAYLNAMSAHFASQGVPNVTLTPRTVQAIVRDLTTISAKLSGVVEAPTTPPAVAPVHPADDEPTEGWIGGGYLDTSRKLMEEADTQHSQLLEESVAAVGQLERDIASDLFRGTNRLDEYIAAAVGDDSGEDAEVAMQE